MRYLVCKVDPASPGRDEGNRYNMRDRKDYVNCFYMSETDAKREADRLASETPGVQFGVFAVVHVSEAKKPVLMAKKFNEAGELVVAS